MKLLRPAAIALLAALPAYRVAAAAPWFIDATTTHLPAEMARRSMDIEAVDLDGDGDLDIVAPQEWLPNKILINGGDGRFTDASSLVPAVPEAELVKPPHVQAPLQAKDSEDVSIADFDGDGRLDMIIVVEDDVRLGRANVHTYLRGSADGFVRVYGQLPDTVANAVAHADLTGDGRPDVLIVGDGQDRLLINDGRGGFRDETYARLPREAAVGQDGEFADLDGDGDLDIVLGLEGGHALWLNDGAGGFIDASRNLPPPGDVEARKVTPADVDGDGDLDLYFAHVSWQERDGRDRLFINDGHGAFSDAGDRLPAEEELTLDAKFADLDRDGDLDLVRANGESVRILTNDGSGRFVDVTDEALAGLDTGGHHLAVEIADLNGDGVLDIYLGQLDSQPSNPSHDRLWLGVARP